MSLYDPLLVRVGRTLPGAVSSTLRRAVSTIEGLCPLYATNFLRRMKTEAPPVVTRYIGCIAYKFPSRDV